MIFPVLANWFGVRNKGRAIVTLRTEDMLYCLLFTEMFQLHFPLQIKFTTPFVPADIACALCSAVELHEKVAQLPFQSTNVQEMPKCSGGFSAEQVGFL